MRGLKFISDVFLEPINITRYNLEYVIFHRLSILVQLRAGVACNVFLPTKLSLFYTVDTCKCEWIFCLLCHKVDALHKLMPLGREGPAVWAPWRVVLHEPRPSVCEGEVA